MKIKFITGPRHMEEATYIVDHPGDLIKCGRCQEYILTSSEMLIGEELFRIAIPTIATLTSSEVV